LSGTDHKHLQVATETADCQPVAPSAETDRTDGREFVAPPHLLQHLSRLRIEDADLVAFLGGGGQFVSVVGEQGCGEC